LVQKGVPLNTVRDLLGHGSVGMSLRYAHLAPDQPREAVAKLNEKPLLTLTMRLQWEGLPIASGHRVDSFVVREGQASQPNSAFWESIGLGVARRGKFALPRYHADLISGKGGTRTLDPGIMSAFQAG
jgi:hypothetical protein